MWEADQNMFSEATPVLGSEEKEEGEGEVYCDAVTEKPETSSQGAREPGG